MTPDLKLPQQLPAVQSEDVASVKELAELYRGLGLTPSIKAADLAKLPPPSKVAAVSIYEMRRRFSESPNVGRNLALLFHLLGTGMQSVMPGDRVNPRAMGSGCGDGCGTGCGSGCMSAVAGGFGCGNGCGNNCMGAENAGLMCGGGCGATGLKQLSFDREGVALEGVKFKGLNIGAVAAAMRNADRAYNEAGLAQAPADKPDW